MDYISDEKDHPFCPFGLDEFTDFVTEYNAECKTKKIKSRLGMRYHCGEMNFSHSIGSDYLHMEITCKIIQKILDKKIPLRLGHGIAFLAFEHDLNDRFDIGPQTLEIVKTLNSLKNKKTTFEINLRSNEFLVFGKENKEGFKILNTMGLNFILSTDNDGIWDVENKVLGTAYRSVAGEFASAISHQIISSKEQLNEIVERAGHACFSDFKQPEPPHNGNQREKADQKIQNGTQTQVDTLPSMQQSTGSKLNFLSIVVIFIMGALYCYKKKLSM